MTDLKKDNTYDDLAPGERRKRQKKRLPTRLSRLLMLLAAIVVVIVVIVLIARAAINNSRVAAYQQYMTTISQMLKQSDAMGAGLTKLLTNPGDITRKDIQTALDKYITDSAKIETQAKALKAPSEVVDQNLQQFLILVFSFRSKGLAELKPQLMTALELQETDVSADQISRSLEYMTVSDFLFKEVFAPKTTQILKDKHISGVTMPTTQFLTDEDLASKSRVQQALALLKSTGNLQEVHGVAIDKIVAKPSDKQLSEGGTYNLTSSDSLTFEVTVENQGNMSEKNVPVVAQLVAPDSTKTQKVTVTIPELKPKEQLVVTVKGLNPTAYGQVAVLNVKVGPVTGEKYTNNNTIEAHVIFTL